MGSSRTEKTGDRRDGHQFFCSCLRALFFLSHQGSESDSDQQSFRSKEATHSLAPGFFPGLDEHSISLRFKLRRRPFDAVHIKLKPGLRDRNVVRPKILANTRLRRLKKRQRAKGFAPCSAQDRRGGTFAGTLRIPFPVSRLSFLAQAPILPTWSFFWNWAPTINHTVQPQGTRCATARANAPCVTDQSGKPVRL